MSENSGDRYRPSDPREKEKSVVGVNKFFHEQFNPIIEQIKGGDFFGSERTYELYIEKITYLRDFLNDYLSSMQRLVRGYSFKGPDAFIRATTDTKYIKKNTEKFLAFKPIVSEVLPRGKQTPNCGYATYQSILGIAKILFL